MIYNLCWTPETGKNSYSFWHVQPNIIPMQEKKAAMILWWRFLQVQIELYRTLMVITTKKLKLGIVNKQ